MYAISSVIRQRTQVLLKNAIFSKLFVRDTSVLALTIVFLTFPLSSFPPMETIYSPVTVSWRFRNTIFAIVGYVQDKW